MTNRSQESCKWVVDHADADNRTETEHARRVESGNMPEFRQLLCCRCGGLTAHAKASDYPVIPMKPFRPEDEASGVLTAIIESSDDAIICKDLNGVICAWNRAAERLFGYTADEVTGQPLSLIFPPDRRNELASILERVTSGQRVEHYETVRQAKDGRLIDVALTVSPVRDATGHIVGATAIARDLTARKQTDVALQTSELRWRSVIDSAVDGIIVIDGK